MLGDLKATLVKALVALVLIGILGATCAGWSASRAQRAADQALQRAERDSSRATARRLAVLARDHFVRANAKAHIADSLARRAHRSDSLAIVARDRLTARGPLDTTDVVALRDGIRARDSVITAQALALADARVVAPAYAVAIESFRPAVELSLDALGASQRADTLSQTFGASAARSAHWRGVKQGVVGTVVTGTVVFIVGALLHAGGKL